MIHSVQSIVSDQSTRSPCLWLRSLFGVGSPPGVLHTDETRPILPLFLTPVRFILMRWYFTTSGRIDFIRMIRVRLFCMQDLVHPRLSGFSDGGGALSYHLGSVLV